MRVLVTDSNTRPALAVIRTLGRSGHEVIAACERHPSLGSVSRFCSSREMVPSAATNPAAFIDRLIQVTHEQHIDLLLPITEISTLEATLHRTELWTGCALPFPDHATVSRASDKAFVLELAASLGVPTPLTAKVEDAAELRNLDLNFQFPVVIKPSRSRVRAGSGWFSTSVQYAWNRESLTAALEALPQAAYPVLLQERIVGPGRGVFACFDRGEPVMFFSHRRLREKPPSGGVSVLAESAPLDPVAVHHATKVLTSLKWHGVAMVEFKEDSRDGSLRLMEINARFWGSLQLAIDSGADFPQLLAAMTSGVEELSLEPYRIGVRTRWLAGDLDSMLMQLLRSRTSLSLPPSHPGRLSVLLDFMRFWGPNLRYEVEQWEDPGPMLLEWRRRLLGR